MLMVVVVVVRRLARSSTEGSKVVLSITAGSHILHRLEWLVGKLERLLRRIDGFVIVVVAIALALAVGAN